MPGSRWFHVAFCRTNLPPYVEGVCDVLCGVVECKRRRGANNQTSSKTSLISHTVTLHRHVSFVHKDIEFLHFYISVQVPVCFDGEAIHSPVHMQKCAVIWKVYHACSKRREFFSSVCRQTPPPPASVEGCLMQRPQTINPFEEIQKKI